MYERYTSLGDDFKIPPENDGRSCVEQRQSIWIKDSVFNLPENILIYTPAQLLLRTRHDNIATSCDVSCKCVRACVLACACVRTCVRVLACVCEDEIAQGPH